MAAAITVPEAKRIEVLSKECDPFIVELVNHLKGTGTGTAKQLALLEIGSRTKDNVDAFIEQAKGVVSPTTMDKVNDFFGTNKPQPKQQPAGKK